MFTRKRKLIFGGAAAAVGVVALAGAAVFYTVMPHDAPEQATLSGAVASVQSAQNPAEATGDDAAAQASDLAGTWEIAPGSESFVGYRVKEELATVGTFTAVGRTKGVTGTLEFDGDAISDVRVTADLTTLQSDNAMRDGQLRRQALETAAHPTATFVLTRAIELDGVPAEGETVSATAVGDLTLHGVTRSVSIPLQGQLANGFVVVVGALDIAFADFNIQKPSSQIVLGVEDHGLLELQLVFQRGSQG